MTMACPFGPDSRVLASPHLRVLPQGDGVVVVADDTALTYRGGSAETVASALPRLNGQVSLADVAQGTRCSWQTVAACLTPLAEDAWVVDVDAVFRAVSSAQFLCAYRALCEFWKKDIFIHPFWDTLAGGHASPELLLGWLVEFYHYVDGANEHMPMAAANCRGDNEVQLWLARHYAEEYDHNAIFLKGLVQAGLHEDRVRMSTPLASTRAVLNYLTEVAASDTLAYAAMHGIFQTPGSTEAWRKVDRFYAHLLEAYPFGAPVLRAFRDHAALDADLGHDELVFSRICARTPAFASDQLSAMLDATRGLVDVFVLFFDGIYDAYTEPNTVVPRPRVSIHSLL